MQCFEVDIPEGSEVVGRTAAGDLVPVYPGEYLVHALPPKAGAVPTALLRFVGADPQGRDVYVRADRVPRGIGGRMPQALAA